MQFLTIDELPFYVVNAPLPSTTSGKFTLIFQASSVIERIIGQSLEIRNYSVQIPLDLNYTGVLPYRRFIKWNNPEEGSISIPGVEGPISIDLSNFDVETDPGIIKYRGGGVFSKWGNTSQSLWDDTIYPYHSKNIAHIDDNVNPYLLNASYRAGYFTTVDITASGAAGTDQVTVSSVVDLAVNNEFSFSGDVANEPSVSSRTILSINDLTNTITFTPAVSYNLTTAMTLRMIDTNIKVAMGLLIGSFVTFPGSYDLISFSKGLGRGALTKSWTRSSKRSSIADPMVMSLLSSYMF